MYLLLCLLLWGSLSILPAPLAGRLAPRPAIDLPCRCVLASRALSGRDAPMRASFLLWRSRIAVVPADEEADTYDTEDDDDKTVAVS